MPIKRRLTSTSEYDIWRLMNRRCQNQKDKDYPQYGGRGVKVCDRWIGANGFQNFLEDMGTRTSKSHSIDRKDVDGDYEPGNCRWATAKEQNRNKRNNRNLTFQGRTQCLTAWAEEFKINRETLARRLDAGWTIYAAASGMDQRPTLLTLGQETKSLSQWARETGISRSTLNRRLRDGWTPEKTLTTPVN